MRQIFTLLALFFTLNSTVFAQYNWQTLAQSPQNGQKQDDVFFLSHNLGWSVNGSGRIYKTINGGATWTKILDKPCTYFRCIGFMDSLHGFAGNIGMDYFPNVTDATPLYRTNDGGQSWEPVTTINGPAPKGLCAIQVVSPQVIVAGGRVGGPAYLIRSTDGGSTWKSQSMDSQIAMLTDLYFTSPDTGFVFGGTDPNVQFSKAVILRTVDGGLNWNTVYQSTRPFELIWKAHFPTPTTAYATLLSYAPNTLERFVAKSTDGGLSWSDIPLVNNGAKAFGVGFLNENTGWVGCDNSIYETKDGGQNWTPKNIGQYVNKIRILPGLAYGIGVRIYKMTPAASADAEPNGLIGRLQAWPNPAHDSVNFTYNLERSGKVTIQLIDNQGKILINKVLSNQSTGQYTEKLASGVLSNGAYILRISADGQLPEQTTLIIQNKP